MQPAYFERVSSTRTLALFLVLGLVFLALFALRFQQRGLEAWGVGLLFLSAFFLFYTANYRTLAIRITRRAVHLRFGVFSWDIPLEEVETCYQDTTSLWRIGGAGIHFSPIRGRYRAMFNLLEYPRVVVALKRRRGLVRDVAFTTKCPAGVIRLVLEGTRAHDPGRDGSTA